MSRAYKIVAMFEEAVAEWVGAKYGVAVDNCTNALYLALRYHTRPGTIVTVPARTFLSVPQAVLRAGCLPDFRDAPWRGQYLLGHTRVVDSAGQLGKDTYPADTTMCVSFQYRKPVPIGKGGMLLTNDPIAAGWFRRMRYCGRDQSAPFDFTLVQQSGYNMTMTPEQAARGLTLLELAPPTRVFDSTEYQDLRACPLWQASPETSIG